MEMSDIIEQQRFWENQRREQMTYVIKTQSPVIADYFEGLQKVAKDDEYKKILLDLIDELSESETLDAMKVIIKKYKAIMAPYLNKIIKLERGDSDIGLYQSSDLELTKSRIEPVEAICNFIDNLIYGGWEISQIEAYLKMWKEKAQVNALEASETEKAENGRHYKNPY